MRNQESLLRRFKRKAMKEAGLTFTQRMRESVRTGKPVGGVKFSMDQKRVVATKA